MGKVDWPNGIWKLLGKASVSGIVRGVARAVDTAFSLKLASMEAIGP